MTNTHILLLDVVVFLGVLLHKHCCYAHQDDEDIRFIPSKNGHKANWRYYYNHNRATSTPSKCCETVIVSAVGTAMDVSDYHRLAQTVVATNSAVHDSNGSSTAFNGENGGVVFVVLDAASKNPDKSNAKQFAEAVTLIQNEIIEKLPHCCGVGGYDLPSQRRRWLIGGHSSGGRAAAVAVHQKLIQDVHGYLGLAPYLKPVPSDLTIPIPSLSWGFLMESCLVSPQLAALRAYDLSRNDSRVVYQVVTDNRDVVFKGGHCTFTNHGCKFMCIGDQTTPDMTSIVHQWVADSIKVFIKSLKSDSFEKADFERVVHDSSRQVNIAVNQEMSPKQPQIPPPIWPNQWSAEFTTDTWDNIGATKGKKKKTGAMITSNQKGGIYYDYTNGRMLERYDAGQIMDDRCRCTGGMVDNTMTCKILSFRADNHNANQNKSSIYVVTTDIKANNTVDCCLLHTDDDDDQQGILLEPTWMKNNTAVIQGPPVHMNGRICHSWINSKTPNLQNSQAGYSWLVSHERGEICGFKGNFKKSMDPSSPFLGLSPYLAFDPKTYAMGSQNNDDQFTLPTSDGGFERCAKSCEC